MSSHKKLMAEEFLDGLCHGEVIQDIQPSTVQHPRDRPRDLFSFEFMGRRFSTMKRYGVCDGTDHNKRRCPLASSESVSLGSQ
ncbi:hypothetical protein CU098_003496, partial [Rhizopus stolonifer]